MASFEFLKCKVNLKDFILNLVNVYHPLYPAKNEITFLIFLKTFEEFFMP